MSHLSCAQSEESDISSGEVTQTRTLVIGTNIGTQSVGSCSQSEDT
ncbi:hypothetical protein RRG08_018778 [Elysia crispata]|uniref:Uncharacterized protein n=1 Tax=Elysia crispata TaxID=231223 RepID=A0AAE1AQW4_9GAST|nr:hypothetical protein RRG08_018778 [Elysia crispata]